MRKITEKEIIDVLKQCYDPEIPIDLWSLGLIYNIEIKKNNSNNYNIDIIMTLTTPGCSMGNTMAMDIKSKLEMNSLIDSANITITFDPPWNPGMMNSYAKDKLGFTKTKDNESDNKKQNNWE